MTAPLLGFFRSSSGYAVASGLSMAVAWWTPGSVGSVFYGWLASVFLALSFEARDARYRSVYLTGLVQNTLGFYWLAHTIGFFGGFPTVIAIAIFALFVLVSSLQNPLALLLFRSLPRGVHSWGASLAVAWVSTEIIPVRIFPWLFGHTQLGFSWLAQSADLAGVPIISFIMLWVSQAIVRRLGAQGGASRLAIAAICLIALVGYGALRSSQVEALPGEPLTVSLVQANITISDKHEVKLFEQNKERYIELSQTLPAETGLTLWPETVIQDWVYEGVGSTSKDPRLPQFSNFHLLTGSLSFRGKGEIFNSALAIHSDGRIPLPYHKKILMPFGEFMPLGSIFPSLYELNPGAGHFTSGTGATVLRFPPDPLRNLPEITVAPLICYEDIVPSLAWEGVEHGATLLVNLTNDAWFGDTIAPHQHHLIASFRAIETRRFLLRSTNSGLTAIVNPLGETTGSLPPFSEGVLSGKVQLLSGATPVTSGIEHRPWWLLLVFAGACCLLSFVRRVDW